MYILKKLEFVWKRFANVWYVYATFFSKRNLRRYDAFEDRFCTLDEEMDGDSSNHLSKICTNEFLRNNLFEFQLMSIN